MRRDRPSHTAREAARARARLERPATPTGDTHADERLAACLFDDGPSEGQRATADTGLGGLEARTQFFDAAVLDAIAIGCGQVVVLGAGYDVRSLRFRTPGVRYFEVDHPATQRDKRDRLERTKIAADDVTFVAVDFTSDSLEAVLPAAGFDPSARSLILCEGVLRYLPERSFRNLLRTTAALAAPTSSLAVSISTDAPAVDHDRRAFEQARARRLADLGEPVLTEPSRSTALEWLRAAGWSPTRIMDERELVPTTRPGRLLVSATPSAWLPC